MGETVSSIVAAHHCGAVTPEETIARTFARIRVHGDSAVFISLHDEAKLRSEACALPRHMREQALSVEPTHRSRP